MLYYGLVTRTSLCAKGNTRGDYNVWRSPYGSGFVNYYSSDQQD